jgi:hypothetical protein
MLQHKVKHMRMQNKKSKPENIEWIPAKVLERLLDGELAIERQLLRHVAHIGTRHQ